MKKKVELNLVEPIFSTYHFQGSTCSIIGDNPSIRNWHLNESVNLRCLRKFLFEFAAIDVCVSLTQLTSNPFINHFKYSTRFFMVEHINQIVKNMLDAGIYVYFHTVDDYFIDGKTWYKKRHLNHDGLICGYDDEDGTFTIYAYDINWIYRKFKTPQTSFYQGCLEMIRQGEYPGICGLSVKNDIVEFDPYKIRNNIIEYLDSSLELYSPDIDQKAYGVVVYEYLSMYLKMMSEGIFPYEKMDRRAFRMVWEHERAMHERIKKTEDVLGISNETSSEYEQVLELADSMRNIYAFHRLKRRDSILLPLERKLSEFKNLEYSLLSKFLDKTEKFL